MSKTCCIVPWTNLAIAPDGRVNFCCEAPTHLTVDGRVGSVYRDSIDDLWNSPEIVEVRAAMSRGEKPALCQVCWDREAAGDISRRLSTNSIYRHLGGSLAVETLPQQGADTGYRLTRRPDWFTLELGNACDLKCRSCLPSFSSRIAADPVHTAWANDNSSPTFDDDSRSQGTRKLVPDGASPWFDDIPRLAQLIASGIDGNATLSLIGGEPFINDRTWRLLDALVERAVAPNLYIALTTNGQHQSRRFEKLAPLFRGVTVALSIDGHGKLYEYLRHGASWARLLDNLPWFQELSNVQPIVVPTFQSANALEMVPLLRFLDQYGFGLGFNAVNWPARLQPTNLPPNIRRIAAGRLRTYLESECRQANVSVVRGYCTALEDAGDTFDAALFNEFMMFTNDLDAERGESLREAAPELIALVYAAGLTWTGARRYITAARASSEFLAPEVKQRVVRTVSDQERIFPGFEAARKGLYFDSAFAQLARIDDLLGALGRQGLTGRPAVADFGCHYGRITRALRAGLPDTAVYSIDIDEAAVRFCAEELGALPAVTGWRPDEQVGTELPTGLDAIVCVSLLTHTPLGHWRRLLSAWSRMLRPGGVAAFTFLSERFVNPWLAGEMEHYGSYHANQKNSTAESVRKQGFGFSALTSGYGDEPLYGVAFAKMEVVAREVANAGLELLAIPAETGDIFGQDLALIWKPGGQSEPESPKRRSAIEPGTESESNGGVSIVAIYDPRCYAPKDQQEGNPKASFWARLTGKTPPPPLPTEIGFADPRVPEVREAQAGLAREHGVDGFCYLYHWDKGPRWNAWLGDLIKTGRPDLKFCLMVAEENGSAIPPADALAVFESIAPALRDPRCLKIDGHTLLMVRDLAGLTDPASIARQWRTEARACGIGELHLCATEPAESVRPEDLGFDSFIQSSTESKDGADYADLVAAALVRPWPSHRFFRVARCKRAAGEREAIGLYEEWLRSALDATRRHGDALVFVDSWNDWLRGCYLEPDDNDGRAALAATRRAVCGPGSGLVLFRQLRGELGQVDGRAGSILDELGQALRIQQNATQRLLASVEAALSRNLAPPDPQAPHWVAVASRQLPPSGGGFYLDRVGLISGDRLYEAKEPVKVDGDQVNLAGWCHTGNCDPEQVALFLVLESTAETNRMDGASQERDVVARVNDRVARPDVPGVRPGYPVKCGFDTFISLLGVRPGVYRVAIVQRTPHAAYRDATPTTISIHGATCSKT
jgi:MoaA/NifB/PqqE/SkfB family radical SAM enzyme/SAM-dependent methyltransferase